MATLTVIGPDGRPQQVDAAELGFTPAPPSQPAQSAVPQFGGIMAPPPQAQPAAPSMTYQELEAARRELAATQEAAAAYGMDYQTNPMAADTNYSLSPDAQALVGLTPQELTDRTEQLRQAVAAGEAEWGPPRSTGETLTDYGRSFMQGGLGNWWDEAAGGIAGLSRAVPMLLAGDENFAGNFEAARAPAEAGERAADASFAARDPAGNAAARIAGTIATTAYPFGKAMSIANPLGRTLATVGLGGLAGGIAGAGDANDGSRGGGALEGATWGGIMGGAMPVAGAVAGGVSKLAGKAWNSITGNPSTARLRSTVADFRSAADDLYAQADAAGVAIAPTGLQDLLSRFNGVLQREGFDQFSQPPDAIIRVMQAAERMAQAPQRSLRQLDYLRQDIRGAATTPAERRLAELLVAELDDFANSLASTPGAVLGGNTAQGVEALNGARALWAQQAKLGVLERAVNNAQVSVVARPSQRAAAYQRQFAAIVKNPRVLGQFTEEEQALIREVAAGGSGFAAALQALGRKVPGPWASAVYGAVSGDWLTAGAAQVGKSALERMGLGATEGRVDDALDLVAGFRRPAPPVSQAPQYLGRLLGGPATTSEPPATFSRTLGGLLPAR